MNLRKLPHFKKREKMLFSRVNQNFLILLEITAYVLTKIPESYKNGLLRESSFFFWQKKKRESSAAVYFRGSLQAHQVAGF